MFHHVYHVLIMFYHGSSFSIIFQVHHIIISISCHAFPSFPTNFTILPHVIITSSFTSSFTFSSSCSSCSIFSRHVAPFSPDIITLQHFVNTFQHRPSGFIMEAQHPPLNPPKGPSPEKKDPRLVMSVFRWVQREKFQVVDGLCI